MFNIETGNFMKDTVIILGSGPPDGLGGALSRCFADAGYHIIVSGRSLDKIQQVADDVSAKGGSIEAYQADVTSPEDQDKLFAVADAHGDLAAVIFNAGNNARIPFEELTAEEFEQYWRVGCLGGFLTAKRAMPILRQQGKGSMLFTGASASLRGKKDVGHFAASKGALRNLVQSLAREYGPHGVHVAHFIIDGIIDGQQIKTRAPEYHKKMGIDGTLSPDALAQAYLYVHHQSRSVWTHEMDLRPFKETW